MHRQGISHDDSQSQNRRLVALRVWQTLLGMGSHTARDRKVIMESDESGAKPAEEHHVTCPFGKQSRQYHFLPDRLLQQHAAEHEQRLQPTQ